MDCDAKDFDVFVKVGSTDHPVNGHADGGISGYQVIEVKMGHQQKKI